MRAGHEITCIWLCDGILKDQAPGVIDESPVFSSLVQPNSVSTCKCYIMHVTRQRFGFVHGVFLLLPANEFFSAVIRERFTFLFWKLIIQKRTHFPSYLLLSPILC